jgi:DNA polymerase-1
MLHADDAFRREGLEARMLMQVHDELLIECAEDECERVAATLKREMENAVELDVPLVAETGIGANWMDAKKQ